MGDLASHDLQSLGGPWSVRGYQLGELASARRVLETAAEIRLPVPKTNAQAYAFAEFGTDLNSSKDVVGNPTAYFRKPGCGGAVGIGLKIFNARTELVQDANSGRRHVWVRFGERF